MRSRSTARTGLAALAWVVATLGCSDSGRGVARGAFADLQEPVTYEGVLRPCPMPTQG
jgi:hypothetical protein